MIGAFMLWRKRFAAIAEQGAGYFALLNFALIRGCRLVMRRGGAHVFCGFKKLRWNSLRIT